MPFRPSYYPRLDGAREVGDQFEQAADAYFRYKQDQRDDERMEWDREDRSLQKALAQVELENDPRYTFDAPPAREYVGPEMTPESLIPDRPAMPDRLLPTRTSPLAPDAAAAPGQSYYSGLGMAQDPRTPQGQLPSNVIPPWIPEDIDTDLAGALGNAGLPAADPSKPLALPGQFLPEQGYSAEAIYPDPPRQPQPAAGFRSNPTPEPVFEVYGRPVFRERGGAGAAADPASRDAELIAAARAGDPDAQALLLARSGSGVYNSAMRGYGEPEGEDPELAVQIDLMNRMLNGDEAAEREYAARYPNHYRTYRDAPGVTPREPAPVQPTASQRENARWLELQKRLDEGDTGVLGEMMLLDRLTTERLYPELVPQRPTRSGGGLTDLEKATVERDVLDLVAENGGDYSAAAAQLTDWMNSTEDPAERRYYEAALTNLIELSNRKRQEGSGGAVTDVMGAGGTGGGG